MQNHCRTGEEYECEELSLRRGLPLPCGVMGFAALVTLNFAISVKKLFLSSNMMETVEAILAILLASFSIKTATSQKGNYILALD